jgi:hypothetical protein
LSTSGKGTRTMMQKPARGSAMFALLVSLVTACATSTRPPNGASPSSAGDAGAHDEADDEATDADGDVEVTSEAPDADPTAPCPKNMVLVASGELRFCVDKYEASLVETDVDGNDKPYPHWLPVDGHTVRAVSQPGVFPQGFISEVQAEDACAASGKRLCSHVEWKTACMGPAKTTFPYGEARRPGVCHDAGKSAVGAVFGFSRLADPIATNAPTNRTGGASKANKPRKAPARPSGRQASVIKGRAAETTRARPVRGGVVSVATKSVTPGKKRGDRTAARVAGPSAKRTPARTSSRPASVELSVWTQLNDPRLGQVEGALARTGSHEECVNGYGALDMVGNLHEWVRTDPSAAHGTFAGGYYLDTSLNGDGCQYRTTAHAHDYHDYSTGFRCCAEPRATARTD